MDSIGLGSGVYSRLKEQGYPAYAVVVSERAEDESAYINGSEDSDGSDWTATDEMVVTAWMGENSPGYVENPPPLQKPAGSGRPRLTNILDISPVVQLCY